ncbi:hypothetical protein, partial [Bifidobacterium tissieri]|uniref:hypothetical protein n=1 Tax=Bifidobacterium tissieri TaxID=1630162 RepID=UPI001CC2DC7E
VKHAASVRPEPESNPPQKTFMKSQNNGSKKKEKKKTDKTHNQQPPRETPTTANRPHARTILPKTRPQSNPLGHSHHTRTGAAAGLAIKT